MSEQQTAHMVSRVLHPGYLLMGLPLVVGWLATWPSVTGLAWGALAALFCGVLPYIVYRRSPSRALQGGVATAAIVTGIAILIFSEAPWPILATPRPRFTLAAWLTTTSTDLNWHPGQAPLTTRLEACCRSVPATCLV